jgi:Spy/CpxP family protein refolding chaperone
MKLRTSLILSAIALSLTTTPFAVQAQPSSPVAPQGQKQGPLQRLGLSETQRTQIEAIKSETKTLIEGVLNEQQRQQLQAARQNGQGKRGVWSSLNLSEQQKNQIRSIKQAQKAKMEAVLTPAQREQLQQMKNQRGARRQQRQQSFR